MKTVSGFVSVLVVCGLLASGCATQQKELTQAQQGAAIGAAAGAGVGAMVGHNLGNGAGDRDKGALIGGIVGSVLGYQLGSAKDTLDQQQSQIGQIQAQQNTTVIWITNSNGSRTPVTLRQSPSGMWIGPRGEYYIGLPTPEQLKPYGF
jgi:hypothetical protein